MIPYTIWPAPEEGDPLDEEAAGEPEGPPGDATVYDILLGYERGVPVRALAAWDGSVWRMVRLVTTDPALYLEPALAPGSALPLPWPEALRAVRLSGHLATSQSRA